MYVFKRVERLSQSQALPSVEFINLKEPRMDGLGCEVGVFRAVATCCQRSRGRRETDSCGELRGREEGEY